MKFTKILLICLILILMFNSCGKSNEEKDDFFYGYEQESESAIEKSQFIIDGQVVSSDLFEIHIPQEYALTDNGNSLQIINENDSFNVSIEEHEYTDDNFERYLSDTIDEYRQMGVEVSEPQTVAIGDYEMMRIALHFGPMSGCKYYTDQGEKAFSISVISNKTDISSDDVDKLFESIKLITE